MLQFNGKVALITGAARGIGRAASEAFAEHGATVAVLDSDEDEARDLATQLNDRGSRAMSFPCDVAVEAQVRDAVSKVMTEFGAIDVLFNNAGVTRRLPVSEWTEDDWMTLLRVNLIGVFTMTRAVGMYMVERRMGSIVNMSALGGGCVGLGRGSQIYTATKAGVAALTRDFAAEWARFGVRVNCVAPGWIETEMNRPLLNNTAAREKVLDRVPLGRWGTPGDVAGPVLFLASDAARYITGHLLPVDGGANNIIQLTRDDVIR